NPSSFGSAVNRGVTGSGGIGTNSDPARRGTGLNLFANPEAVFNRFRPVLISQDGRTGRANPVRGLPFWNLDFSVGKRTNIDERISVVVTADLFNTFNNVNFADPALSLTNRGAFG